MKDNNQCIFASSKYYKLAFANAQKICQPLGSSFFSEKQAPQLKLSHGSLCRKLLFQKPLQKVLSQKRCPIQKLPQHLTLSDSKRKNSYLSASPLTIINKTSSDIIQQLSTKYMPTVRNSTKNTIDFVNTFRMIAQESMFAINDFSLTRFFVYYDGDNEGNLNHVVSTLDKEFLEYRVDAITNFNQPLKDRQHQNAYNIPFSQQDITNKQKIDIYIQRLKQKAKQIDQMNEGLHFFIGDRISNQQNYDILRQQTQNLDILQFYLYLISKGILGQGQSALIKLRGTIRHKTTDFLFLFKLLFTKISLVKPAYSNFLSSEKYLICQGYVSQNGQEVAKYLDQNFHLLAQFGEEKLLVLPQMIFREETHTDNTKNFNDSLVIRGLKEVLELFLKNSNLEIYPPKVALIERLNSYDDPAVLDSIIEEIQKLVPDQETIKNQSQANQGENQGKHAQGYRGNKGGIQIPQMQQKQATLDIFDFMKLTAQSKPLKKPQEIKKPILNEQQQLQKKLTSQFKQQQRIREQNKKLKKQKQKKQKQKNKTTINQPHHQTAHYYFGQN